MIAQEEDDENPGGNFIPENGTVNPHEPENFEPAIENDQEFHGSDNGYNQNRGNQHAQGWKCNICGQLMRDRNRLRMHKLQCAKNYQLPLRKSGQPVVNSRVGIGQGKGHCCYHCDRMFPTKDELRNHVAEINKKNLAEY